MKTRKKKAKKKENKKEKNEVIIKVIKDLKIKV